ncbi:MAG: HD domain-containing phosphohydrolase [Candidatus Omnitrophota bacterium]|jgi:putative two-component system response regulator
MDKADILQHSKILILDDEIGIAMAIEDILKDSGYQMIRAITDSRQALDVFREFQPDLLILDIKMPHLNGFEVLEQLKPVRKDSFVPVLILTAETDEGVCTRALSAGATDFLSKPMKITEALVRIQNLLEVRRLNVELASRRNLLEDKVEDRTEQLRRAIQEINVMHEQVKKAYIETIYRLTQATEYKDAETAHHVRRLSHYALLLGKEAGLNESAAELLLYASPMHDIGKIGIPDSILFKTDPLTEAEWEIMKSHTTIGYNILKDSEAPVLKLGAAIALSHHERWDGSGYPQGLKGEEASLEARILALVDVYDALRSKRYYKPSFDHARACKIMLEGDNRVQPEHFDPNLLSIFGRLNAEFERIYEENNHD